jgi:uncharacterized Zn finger protein (UPF0148 family)
MQSKDRTEEIKTLEKFIATKGNCSSISCGRCKTYLFKQATGVSCPHESDKFKLQLAQERLKEIRKGVSLSFIEDDEKQIILNQEY